MASNDDMDQEEVYREEEPQEVVTYSADIETTCTICHAEFLDPDDLKIHLDQVHKITSSVDRKCYFCLEEYSDYIEYAEHIRDFHLTALKCCASCWRVFSDSDAYRLHCKKHISKNLQAFNCSQCPQRFGDLPLLKQHEFDHHRNKGDGVMLHDIFPYLSAVLKVKAITFLESLDSDVVYICVGCDFSTVDLFTYIRHIKTQDCKVFVCKTCSNVFKKKSTLANHGFARCNLFGIKHRSTRLCPDCNTNINVKIYRKHKAECKPIKCYSCDIIFHSMNEWSEHQSKEHTEVSVEVETCQFCWKRCVGSVAMKKHIDKTHRPEFHLYKYLCVYCKNVFKHPQKLFGHFATQHKEIFPYTCKICNSTFRYRKKFTIHIKLEHNSVGFVEFDENYHVFFTEKKSENPFVPKSIFNVEEPDSVRIIDSSGNVELNSDFMDITETEGNQTEVEKESKIKHKKTSKSKDKDIIDTDINQSKETRGNSRLKRKRNPKEEIQTSINLDSSDDDEPLLVVRKRVKLQKKKEAVSNKKKKINQVNRMLLTCKICKKYCYTYQNYNHHISLHSKHEVKKCIKCSKIFKSKSKLSEHIAKEHSSSKLTETLKSLLEKRKTGGSLTEDLPAAEKFRRTIKRVDSEVTTTPAKITEVDHKLSVQKFFENFVPEDRNDGPIESTATVKLVSGFYREPSIKMTRFKPTVKSKSLKLSMPVKFVDKYPEKVQVSFKMVEPSAVDDSNQYYSDHYEEVPDMDRHESIPEVAEEVLLEGTEEIPKINQTEVAHKIVIPKLPTELAEIRIAHLQPEAPFYKIVKVKDVLAKNNEEKNEQKAPTAIKLADGTKFIVANPLAHLLGKEQEKVLESVKNKYYKPKNKNIPGMLAKALTMLDKPSLIKKKRREEARMTEEEMSN